MGAWIWVALSAIAVVAAGGLGLVDASSQPSKARGFICPITGEELPCPNCCPLNQGK